MKVICTELNPGQIADSGQCFRMRKIGPTSGTYEIIAGDRRVVASTLPDGMELNCGEEEYGNFWRSYFDMDTDYASIIASVDPGDKYLSRVAQAGSGIRILKQDPWEMIVTFLISQQNNIPRIRRCIENICTAYGRECTDTGADGNTTYHAFPTPESMAGLGDDDLMPHNLGYRSKYVVRAAKAVADGMLDPNELIGLDHEEAREKLLAIYGVGNKVADCIRLFGLHHLEAFPVDTHIRQVLEREYGTGYAEAFPFSRYRKYLGVIQQYMFYGELVR